MSSPLVLQARQKCAVRQNRALCKFLCMDTNFNAYNQKKGRHRDMCSFLAGVVKTFLKWSGLVLFCNSVYKGKMQVLQNSLQFVLF